MRAKYRCGKRAFGNGLLAPLLANAAANWTVESSGQMRRRRRQLRADVSRG